MVKYLLDEHYPEIVATQLRQRDIDARAVIADGELRGVDDKTILAVATQEGRLVVTEDVTTSPAAIAKVPKHSGVIFCESRRFQISGHVVVK